MKPNRGPPMTLGSAAAAGVRLVVWCRDCGRQVEPAPGEMAERYGADMTIPDLHARLRAGDGVGVETRPEALSLFLRPPRVDVVMVNVRPIPTLWR